MDYLEFSVASVLVSAGVSPEVGEVLPEKSLEREVPTWQQLGSSPSAFPASASFSEKQPVKPRRQMRIPDIQMNFMRTHGENLPKSRKGKAASFTHVFFSIDFIGPIPNLSPPFSVSAFAVYPN
jgi:hypothetical protein